MSFGFSTIESMKNVEEIEFYEDIVNFVEIQVIRSIEVPKLAPRHTSMNCMGLDYASWQIYHTSVEDKAIIREGHGFLIKY